MTATPRFSIPSVAAWPAFAVSLALGFACSAGSGEVAELEATEKADAAGVLVDVAPERPAEILLHCGDASGCEIDLAAELVVPAPCELLPGAAPCGGEAGGSGELDLASLAIEAPSGELSERDVVLRQQQGELGAAIEGSELSGEAGTYHLELASERALQIAFEARWHETEDDEGGEDIDGIHLCERGLEEGDVIDSHIDSHFASGETLVVCDGTYELGGLDLSGENWEIVAPNGAVLRASSPATITTDGANYRLSGFVFDQTADGAYVSLSPGGDDWVIERTAWQGEHPGGAFLMTPSVASEGAEGLVDRVYMGDGQVEGSGGGGVWVNANRGHHGELTFRRAYIAHFIDNGLYATGPPTQGQPGKTHVEESYFWSNTISNARTGSLSGPCTIRETVFVLDETTQACDENCSSPGARTTRAVWSWYGEVIVEDSDFSIDHGQRLATAQGGSVTEAGNRVGEEARTEPPEGVPTSPEDIADGDAGSADPDPDPDPDPEGRVEIDYGEHESPESIYNVNDNRSGIAPTLVSEPTHRSDTALRTEFSSAQKTANLEYRFEEHGEDQPEEVYTRFYVYPEGVVLPEHATLRMFWLPLTNGPGSSGAGATGGTNGWSNAIGFSHRNDAPAPEAYHFFSYSYHMDRGGSGDFEMTSAPVYVDEWNLVEGYVRANSFEGGSAEHDGVMRYWINGELAYERENFRVTTSEDNLIEGVGPLGYVVGADLAGAALVYEGHVIDRGGVPDDAESVRAQHRDYLAQRGL